MNPKPPLPRPGTPRLGRGLAALFGDMPDRPEAEDKTGDIQTLALDLLDPNPFQPRMEFAAEALRELSESIRTHGLLQPILVRRHPEVEGRYQIVAGERRWRAAEMAGLREIPVIRRDLPDPEAAAAALIENLQRENLNPMEEAEGYQRLTKHFGLTHEALGVAVSKSRAHVGNTMRLLNLPDPIREHVRTGALSLGHARALLTLPDPGAAAREILKKGLSVRQTEQLAKRLQTREMPARPAAAPDTAKIEQDLAVKIGRRVKLAASPRGDGTLTLWFDDLFQLDELIARLTGNAGD